jgi:hypothetical protein
VVRDQGSQERIRSSVAGVAAAMKRVREISDFCFYATKTDP